jgi:hypothetical protein
MPSGEKVRKAKRRVGGEVMSLDKPGGVGTRKQDWIANQLRRVYDEALQEEIPADMLALLEQLNDKAPDGEVADAEARDGESGEETGA